MICLHMWHISFVNIHDNILLAISPQLIQKEYLAVIGERNVLVICLWEKEGEHYVAMINDHPNT